MFLQLPKCLGLRGVSRLGLALLRDFITFDRETISSNETWLIFNGMFFVAYKLTPFPMVGGKFRTAPITILTYSFRLVFNVL